MKSLFTALHLATGAGPALPLLLALVILLFHIWASRRSPRYWYLGGIVPLAWFLCLGILLFNGRANWATSCFPPWFSSCSGWRAIWPPKSGSWRG